MVYPEEPDKVLQTSYVSITESSEAVFMFPTARFQKRKVHDICLGLYVAGTWISTSDGYVEEVDSVELSIELYSGNANELSNLSYNSLVNNAQKHKWYAEEETITIIASKGKSEYDISAGISGIQRVIDSDADTILLCLRAVNSSENINIMNLYEESVWLRAETYSLAPVLKNPNPVNVIVYTNKPQLFSWEYEGDGSEQKAYEIGWSSDNGSTWNSEDVLSDVKEHLYPKDTFPEAIICWRIKATNEEGTSGEYLVSEFKAVIQRPVVTTAFPNEINIQNQKEQIFTWNYSGEDLAQKSYEIGWSSDNGSTWHSIEVTSSNAFHVFAAETFPTGEILWRIRATNSDGYVSEYAYGKFGAVGQSEAPEIESVSQDAIPTIGWSTSNQEAFEIQITGEGVSYESGMIAGAEIRSYQPNIMLADGLYQVKVRILNSYGFVSEWGETIIFLHTEKPDSSPVLMLKENNLFGVTLIGSGISGRGFYVRKGDASETTTEEEDVIIAEYVEGKTVIDCDLQPGKEYTYVLRDYSGGYIESTSKKYTCDFSGVIFHDVEDLNTMIHIWLSEEEYVRIESSLRKSAAYKQCIGREFPIKESDIHKTEMITVTGFLDLKQYQKAYELYYSDKKVLFRHKEYCCHADISDFKKQRYFDIGYIVTIVFERLDRNDEVRLV